jgi:hypothetical protein
MRTTPVRERALNRAERIGLVLRLSLPSNTHRPPDRAP